MTTIKEKSTKVEKCVVTSTVLARHIRKYAQAQKFPSKNMDSETDTVVNLVKSWIKADYNRKKEVAAIMIHQIIISEDGSTKIIWNI